jgi:hypothetical protein
MRDRFSKRLQNLEQTLCPRYTGCFTVEELCRSLWRRDRAAFVSTAADLNCRYLISQFELEESGPQRPARQRRRSK